MSESFGSSIQQQHLWKASEASGRNIIHSLILMFRNQPDLSVLKEAIRLACREHEMLSVKFEQHPALKFPQQLIAEDELTKFDIRDFDKKEAVEDVLKQVEDQLTAEKPLSAVFTVFLNEQGTMSFIISAPAQYGDIDSLFILSDDIARTYYNLLNESMVDSSRSEETLQYIDYSEWQQELLNSSSAVEKEKLWIEAFTGKDVKKSIPFESMSDDRGSINTITHGIGKDLAEKIENFAAKRELESGLVVFAGWYQLLRSFCPDVIVARKNMMRHREELKTVVGPFEKYCPYPPLDEASISFEDVLKKLCDFQTHSSDALEYLFSGTSGKSLSEVKYLFQELKGRISNEKGLFTEHGVVKSSGESFKLKLSLMENYSLMLEYDSNCYARSTAEALLLTFISRLQKYILEPKALSGPSLLNAPEVDYIQSISSGADKAPVLPTVLAHLNHQANVNPERVATSHENGTLTYKELAEQSYKWAGHLRQNFNILPGSIVAVHLSRSESLLPVLLGIWKAGACYLPIDLYLPEHRKSVIVEDSDCQLIIAEGIQPWMKDSAVLSLTEYESPAVVRDILDSTLDSTEIDSKSCAYIIYTSGTTGKPKGVKISHEALNNYVVWFNEAFSVTAQDSTVLFSSIGYDLCYSGLWTTLSAGGTIHLLKEAQYLNPEECLNCLADYQITFMKMTPSHLKLLMGDPEFDATFASSDMRMLVLGGEAIDTGDLKSVLATNPGLSIVNHYGPTETTIGTLACEVKSEDCASFCRHPVIGKPVNNNSFYVLDHELNKVPLGEEGELYIAGKGVALGYLNRDDLTRERFIRDPYKQHEVIYKTGDIVKLWPDGNISYIGRVDNQIKIRGNRVELEEIEAVIHEVIPAGRCVVRYEENQNARENMLVAYIEGEPFKPGYIKEELKKYLPVYMIPDLLIHLDMLPLNANGKIDKSQLHHRHYNVHLTGDPGRKPESKTEKELAKIWEDVLGILRPDIDVSFFDFGGHSLIATKLIARIRQHFEIKVSLKHVFDLLTIHELAAFIDSQGKEKSEDIKPAKAQLYYELSAAQRQIWVLSQLAGHETVFNMPKAYVMGELNESIFSQVVLSIVKRHETLRTTFIEVNDEPRQVIHDAEYFKDLVEYIDLSSVEEPRKKAAELVEQESKAPFDLTRGPLFRVKLIKIENGLSVFAYNMHHIISDAWSKEILIQEITTLYKAFEKGESSPLVPLQIHYKDYVQWLNSSLSNEKLMADKTYWLSQFKEQPEPLNLPLDNKRPEHKTTHGGAEAFDFEDTLSEAVISFSRQHQVTTFMVLMATLKVLLYRYTGQSDIVVGTPVSGRENEQLHNQIGLYLNNLAIRTRLNDRGTFLEVLESSKTSILGAFEHQQYPFDNLLKDITYKRDFSRSPLYDVVLVLGSKKFSGEPLVPEHEKMEVRTIQTGFRTSIVDLRLVFLENDNGLVNLMIEYNRDLFYPDTIRRLGNQLIQVLKQVLQEPGIRLNDISFSMQEVNGIPERDEDTLQETFNFSF